MGTWVQPATGAFAVLPRDDVSAWSLSMSSALEQTRFQPKPTRIRRRFPACS